MGVVGLAVGVVWAGASHAQGSAAACDRYADNYANSHAREGRVLGGAAIGSLFGAGIGAIFGGAVRGGKRQSVSYPGV